MSPEIFVLACSSLIAAIGFWLAVKQEEKKIRRLAILFCILLTAVAALMGVEEYVRRAGIADFESNLKRDWIVIEDSRIRFVEVEVLSADGMLVPGLREILQNATLEIPSNPLGLSSSASGKVSFGELLDKERILSSGSLGITVATAIVRRDTDADSKHREITDFKEINCMSSTYITRSFATKSDGDETNNVCSVSARIEIGEDIRFVQVADWDHLAVDLALPEDGGCIGPCKHALVVSIKLGLERSSPAPLLEVSPFLLRQIPIQLDSRSVRAKLSGAATSELSKSYFLKSFGYREPDSFAVTKGLLHEAYVKLTTVEKEDMLLIDVIKTTDPSPSLETLLNGVQPDEREYVAPYAAREWCGFGHHDVCWYSYYIFRDQS